MINIHYNNTSSISIGMLG